MSELNSAAAAGKPLYENKGNAGEKVPQVYMTKTAAKLLMGMQRQEGELSLAEITSIQDPGQRYSELSCLAGKHAALKCTLNEGMMTIKVKGERTKELTPAETTTIATVLEKEYGIPRWAGAELAFTYGDAALGICNHIATEGYGHLLKEKPKVLIDAVEEGSEIIPQSPFTAAVTIAIQKYEQMASHYQQQEESGVESLADNDIGFRVSEDGEKRFFITESDETPSIKDLLAPEED